MKAATKKPVVVPIELNRALARSPRAKQEFEKFPPSHKREVIGYIIEAKKLETRERRTAKPVDMLEKGWPGRQRGPAPVTIDRPRPRSSEIGAHEERGAQGDIR